MRYETDFSASLFTGRFVHLNIGQPSSSAHLSIILNLGSLPRYPIIPLPTTHVAVMSLIPPYSPATLESRRCIHRRSKLDINRSFIRLHAAVTRVIEFFDTSHQVLLLLSDLPSFFRPVRQMSVAVSNFALYLKVFGPQGGFPTRTTGQGLLETAPLLGFFLLLISILLTNDSSREYTGPVDMWRGLLPCQGRQQCRF